MGKYIRCPRCELNWITEDLDLCEVCKAELQGELVMEDEEEILCPRCKQNYLETGESICASCAAGNSAVEGGVCAPDTEIETIIDGETTVSLAEMQETEWNEEEESFDDDDGFDNEEYSEVESDFEEEEEEVVESVKDDDDFEYPDLDDLDGELEDDEDEDEDEEDED